MTTAAEYLRLTEAEANSAATSAVNVQNQVAVAETFANTATTYANAVGASVAAAETANIAAGLKAIESKNYRDLALLWGNADPNVVVEDSLYSARHYSQLTVNMLAAMQANLNAHEGIYTDNKTVTDAAIAYLGFRLDTGVLSFDSTALEGLITDLENNTSAQMVQKLNTVLYNTDQLELAAFAKSNDISTSNKIIDYLDEAGQIALQAMITSSTNQTKLSYAGVVVDADTGVITSAAGSALATEYGLRVAAIEETIGSSVQPGLGTMQAKYTIKTDVNGNVAGFGLFNTANTDITSAGFSEFIINANSFKVAGTSDIVAPFRVITSPGLCTSSIGGESASGQTACVNSGGTWNAPGTYISDTIIMNATIDAANISNLTIGTDDVIGYVNATNALIAAATINANQLYLTPPDVGAGTYATGTGSRMIIDSDSIEVWEGTNLRVKIGNLT